jgi:hypothetical protein
LYFSNIEQASQAGSFGGEESSPTLAIANFHGAWNICYLLPVFSLLIHSGQVNINFIPCYETVHFRRSYRFKPLFTFWHIILIL